MRFRQLHQSSSSEVKEFLQKHRVALSEAWILEQLENTAQPLSQDDILSVMIEALRR